MNNRNGYQPEGERLDSSNPPKGKSVIKHQHQWQMQEGYILKCQECGKYSIVSKPPQLSNGCFGKMRIARKGVVE